LQSCAASWEHEEPTELQLLIANIGFSFGEP
jgi:hypothetical protein